VNVHVVRVEIEVYAEPLEILRKIGSYSVPSAETDGVLQLHQAARAKLLDRDQQMVLPLDEGLLQP
jgi:hypothetical protein